jgi:hypothetical protein
MSRALIAAAVLAAALAAFAAPAPARTTDVAPALLDRPDFEARAAGRVPRAGASYPYVRCAALYRALRRAARPARGPVAEALRRPSAGERALIAEAARARAEQAGLPRAAAGPQAESDISRVAELYAERFEALAARDPARWWNDALIETDIRACGLLLGSLGAAAPAGRAAPEPAPSR